MKETTAKNEFFVDSESAVKPPVVAPKPYAEYLKEKGVEIDFTDKFWVQKRLDAIDVENEYLEFVGLMVQLMLFTLHPLVPALFITTGIGSVTHQGLDYIVTRKGTGTVLRNPMKRNTDQTFFGSIIFDHRINKEVVSYYLKKVNFLHTRFPGLNNHKMVSTGAFFTVMMPLMFRSALGDEKIKTHPFLGRFTKKYNRATFLVWRDVLAELGISGLPESYGEALELVTGKDGLFDTIDYANFSHDTRSLIQCMALANAEYAHNRAPYLPRDFLYNFLLSVFDEKVLRRARIKPKRYKLNLFLLRALAHVMPFIIEKFPAKKWRDPDYSIGPDVAKEAYLDKGLDPLVDGTDAERFIGFADFMNNPKMDGLKCPFGFSKPDPDLKRNRFTTQEEDKDLLKRKRELGLI